VVVPTSAAEGLHGEEGEIVALVAEWVDREVRPVVRELERDDTYPERLMAR
jgi:hypothetical protein